MVWGTERFMSEEQDGSFYEGGRGERFFTPFRLDVDPMERLLLIDWQDGAVYKGSEPQWLDDDGGVADSVMNVNQGAICHICRARRQS